MTETTVVRMARADDYPNILSLQKANQIGNLSEAERKNGFLSAEIPEDRIGALASDTGIVVAYEQAEFAGFFCISRLAAWRGNAIIDALVESFERSGEYASENIAETMCLFGPMCLSRVARGKGLLEKMIALAITSAKPQFGNAISFIAVDNARSVNAVAKLGYRPVRRFTSGEREYHALIVDFG
ncbi:MULTISPECIES: acetyltransferase [unclassified Burkholderia]|uniref:acetyltransferase n=1 Tax=unclassified Burkholderia TaxID=2613784 RepID=UPI00076E39B8|nr:MULTISPECIES: acetyltransferase [unclassified Burkholderia]KWZ51186.1 acetyltransferase [Burkholderia sp. MSMB1588]